MTDPLDGFDWTTLYERYDARCIGYQPSSPHLARFAVDRPATDRSLYYRLVDAYSFAGRAREADPVGVYKALLYWKLYSQGTTPGMFRKWSEGGGFDRAATELPRLLAALPSHLDRDVESIVTLVKSLGDYRLPGMTSTTTIPVRSTFLHFAYPHMVPIFDRMVLRAIGEERRDANRRYDIFKSYLPFAWQLADRYASAGPGRPESPLRLLDMALWVHRGEAADAEPGTEPDAEECTRS